MKNICGELAPYRETLFDLWEEYMEQKTNRAKIASAIERFHTSKKISEYQQAGQPINTSELIEYDEDKAKKDQMIKDILSAKK